MGPEACLLHAERGGGVRPARQRCPACRWPCCCWRGSFAIAEQQLVPLSRQLLGCEWQRCVLPGLRQRICVRGRGGRGASQEFDIYWNWAGAIICLQQSASQSLSWNKLVVSPSFLPYIYGILMASHMDPLALGCPCSRSRVLPLHSFSRLCKQWV